MKYTIDIRNFKKKEYDSLGSVFEGFDPQGKKLGFTNYYMELDGKPFFGISGEFHFSRMESCYWEDEIIKMKMCGITVISTYVFWIHHEEEEGMFDFEGRKELRKFVTLCQKHGMYVIVRIGPFAHGEVRNGGLPDWLYGKPFEVRKLNEGFLYYTRRFFAQIAKQLEGLYYQDGGSMIAAQIDNEYMHSSAPWELTTGISNEWVFGGDDGEAYMLKIQELAKECGIVTPFYTCTAWGGAITPSNMMPLWGGYAYRPWLFYDGRGEHPSTEEYLYQDYHNNCAVVTSDFKPAYQPEERPYACCEMGGGMMNTYYYRFILPFKSVDAMSNIKIASGCNFLGYYVFQGGTNPKGKHGMFLNEGQVPKMSYDYQAALGEFGQIRPSYERLKIIHLFCNTFGQQLCRLQTVLPEGASLIDPKDNTTLRYAVRTDGKRGFVFINNFQDHAINKDKNGETIVLQLSEEELCLEELGLKAEENTILPFHMDLDGIDLIKAAAQPITKIKAGGKTRYIFLKPEGMKSYFVFEKEAFVSQEGNTYECDTQKAAEVFEVEKGSIKMEILCLNRELADNMYVLSDQTLLFAKGSVLEDENGVRLECRSEKNQILTYPKSHFTSEKIVPVSSEGIFDIWIAETKPHNIEIEVKQTAASRYTISFQENVMKTKDDIIKDVLLQIRYQGDIAGAYIDGDMITDHFCNQDVWEIGLRTFAKRLEKDPLTIVITPLKEGANVKVESAMAARIEQVRAAVANLEEVKVCLVYEFKIR